MAPEGTAHLPAPCQFCPKVHWAACQQRQTEDDKMNSGQQRFMSGVLPAATIPINYWLVRSQVQLTSSELSTGGCHARAGHHFISHIGPQFNMRPYASLGLSSNEDLLLQITTRLIIQNKFTQW